MPAAPPGCHSRADVARPLGRSAVREPRRAKRCRTGKVEGRPPEETARVELAVRAAAERPAGDAAPSPEGAVIVREQRAELLAALAGLSEIDRDVLTCRYFLELSEEETADVLGVRRGTVKSRTVRALDRLREVAT